MSDIVYLNGEFMPLENARISPLDRGFVFGDGVYEVIPVYSRHPFRLAEHFARLQNSLDGIRLANPLSDSAWMKITHDLIERNIASCGEDQSIYLQVTRGVAKRDHAFPKDVKQTVFMMASPLTTPPKEQIDNGARGITANDFRWLKCDVKSVALLGNCLLRQLAVDAGAVETILFRDGKLTEASASNVFVVKKGVLLAPPKDNRVLPGITYDVVMEIAQAREFEYEVRDISEAEVRNADEIWVTSSTKEVLAITNLDGKPVGSGHPGPVFRRMHALYQEFKRDVMRKG
ncbi:MAG: D-amino acid aminotransferase [Betaproteobacteria bacterium]|nr:D-amino acid aminotransferase [Betaproteobacteria bacterium]